MPPDVDRTCRLGLMAKHWEPGKVKTRLGATIGMQRAAKLHRLFCEHLTHALATAADRRSLVISPPQSRGEFESFSPTGWDVEIQSEGDLGRRMQTWFEQSAAAAAPSVENAPPVDGVLIGADCPLISTALIGHTQRLLSDHDVVLGPAVDGGYYLIALRDGWCERYQPLTHQMPWSSADVFTTTCTRAESAGLSVAVLTPMEDIDTESELDRLRTQLRQDSSDAGGQDLLQSIERIMQNGVQT
ncbi:TIGR04282 family arsenosugar biosynthesis glycosyltransferase [Stieleria sp. TO1_6]|nr:TIGR04282 family arsenosugar biosynthesis glycosyltransferase [Stieleria tagensis]